MGQAPAKEGDGAKIGPGADSCSSITLIISQGSHSFHSITHRRDGKLHAKGVNFRTPIKVVYNLKDIATQTCVLLITSSV